jgi:hypothetical protein
MAPGRSSSCRIVTEFTPFAHASQEWFAQAQNP